MHEAANLSPEGLNASETIPFVNYPLKVQSGTKVLVSQMNIRGLAPI